LRPGAPLLLCGDDRMLREVSDSRFRILRYGIENPENQIKARQIAENGLEISLLSNPPGASSIPPGFRRWAGTM
jgi:hypothetical protein